MHVGIRANVILNEVRHEILLGCLATPRIASGRAECHARLFLFRQAKNRLANCFLFLINWPVRQALTLDPLHGARRPFPIANAEAGTIVVPNRKLIEITL